MQITLDANDYIAPIDAAMITQLARFLNGKDFKLDDIDSLHSWIDGIWSETGEVLKQKVASKKSMNEAIMAAMSEPVEPLFPEGMFGA